MHKIALLIPLIIIALTFVPATGQAVTIGGPRIPLRAGSSESLNWAGYADVVHEGTVSVANASFIVPTVQPSKASTYVAVWVGIDGYNDSTVEQTGILAESSHNKVSYSAWYEFYPASPVYAPSKDVVKPGDLIVAWVTYSDGNFTTVIKDITAGWSFTSQPTQVSGALESSAEWIVERPAVGGSLTTLANFKVTDFGEYYTSVQGTSYAAIGGVNGPIGNFNNVAITMVNNHGSTLASPSSLTGSGTSFNVTYYSTSAGHAKR
ncbi:MAG: peptidase A4 [Nitrososphaerota archaeon]|jgi:hypothetical protein|nr:peptidase A4 [Nitrososphaerota archaeon]